MYTNKDIENIDKQIEELYAKRAELEAIEAEKEREQKRKAKEDKDKELIAIKNAIKAFNEKHGENYLLVSHFMCKNDTPSHLNPLAELITALGG